MIAESIDRGSGATPAAADHGMERAAFLQADILDSKTGG
jgi:hypothetical protein